MSREIELLSEIRDLLQVMAEPAIAQRDAKLRSALRSVIGTSPKKIRAVQLMDGSRTQSAIAKEGGIDTGYLSRMVKELATANLIAPDQKYPKLLISVPSNFFDQEKDK